MISDCLYKSHYGEFCNRFIWPTNHDLEKYIVLPNKETVYSNYIVNMFLSKSILYDINNSKNINPQGNPNKFNKYIKLINQCIK